MSKPVKISAIDVLGKRYQDTHGNTYHKAYVTTTYTDGTTHKIQSPIKYGYEREYEATARKMVMSDAKSPYLFRAGEELGIKITSQAFDVKREDLL